MERLWRGVVGDALRESRRPAGHRVHFPQRVDEVAYQTVRVQAGAVYQASAHTWNAGGEETFVRVSWYGSADGSGSALDSVDSAGLAARATSFEQLTTGPIQAPEAGQTARVRLMLRPGIEAPVTVYFDAVTFSPTPERPLAAAGASRSRSGEAASADGESLLAPGSRPPGTEAAAVRMSRSFANVKPAPTQAPLAATEGSPNYDWLALVGITLGGAAIVFAVAIEWSHRRKAGPGP
jgi:hypothetical protein